MYKISLFSRELNYFPILYYLKRMFFNFWFIFLQEIWQTWESLRATLPKEGLLEKRRKITLYLHTLGAAAEFDWHDLTRQR